MSTLLKRTEKVEPKGKKFLAILHIEEEVGALELISIAKSEQAKVTNIDDQIKSFKQQIEDAKKGVEIEEKKKKDVLRRYKEVIEPMIEKAKTNLTREEKNKMIAMEKREKELIGKRENLLQQAEELRNIQDNLDKAKDEVKK